MNRSMVQVVPFTGKDGEQKRLTYRFCREQDVGSIMALQLRVSSGLRPEIAFLTASEDEVGESIEKDVCLALFDGEDMVAFGMLVVNRISYRNIGAETENHPNALLKLTTIDSILVDREYQSYGIQAFLIQRMLTISQEYSVKFACATVSPKNILGLNNYLSQGFQVVRRLASIGGDRFLLKRALGRNSAAV